MTDAVTDEPTVLEHVGTDQAHRDGLARDVARLWVRSGRDFSDDVPGVDDLADALDRLADAYFAE